MITKNGATSVKVRLTLKDSATGLPKTGLDTASDGLLISLIADTESSGVAYSGSNIESITTCGTYAAPTSGKVRFKEVDATNHSGLYEVQAADVRWGVSGAQSVVVSVSATGVLQSDKEVQLVAFDPQDAVRLGLAALPNANAAASGGLPILGTNATAISFTSGMTISNASGSALTLTSSGGNGSGLEASGNGSGAGVKATGGPTGNGVLLTGGSTSGDALLTAATDGNGFNLQGTGSGRSGIRAQANTGGNHGVRFIGSGTGAGALCAGGSTGMGIRVDGGSTSGSGIVVTTTSGDGLSIAPTAGHAIVATANGTDKHGIVATGSASGTGDGIKAVAGPGGVDIRGNILDEVIEGSYTLRQYLRLYASALLAKVSGGATTTNTFRDTGDTKDRIVSTVDADGNRTAVILDGT